MVRGMKAYDLGKGIEVPVGRATLGRVMSVLGKLSISSAPRQ